MLLQHKWALGYSRNNERVDLKEGWLIAIQRSLAEILRVAWNGMVPARGNKVSAQQVSKLTSWSPRPQSGCKDPDGSGLAAAGEPDLAHVLPDDDIDKILAKLVRADDLVGEILPWE